MGWLGFASGSRVQTVQTKVREFLGILEIGLGLVGFHRLFGPISLVG